MVNPITFRIDEVNAGSLAEYGEVSIAFTVRSRYVALPLGRGDGDAGHRWELVKERVNPPWVKDYDLDEPLTRWLRWDISEWRVISAFSGGVRVGGAVVAFDAPEIEFLEDRDDLAALWDFRVAPEWRRRGIGTELFRRVVKYARVQGRRELKIETQDINVVACDFYANAGCYLDEVTPGAYPEIPDETQFNWRLNIH